MARRRNKGEERELAVRRIDGLLAQAQRERLRDRLAGVALGLPERYGELALRLVQRYQTGLTAAQKAQLCRACGAPRAQARTRLRAGRITTTCLGCQRVFRRPLHSRSPPSSPGA